MESSEDPKRWKRKLLEVASAVGSPSLTKVLLEAGVDFSSAGDAGRTPVYTVSRNGHLEVLKLLVEAGADITIPDNAGRTPVYVTGFDGHVREARFLLERGADVLVANKSGMTPLNLAAIDGHYELAELFLANGADIEGPDEDGWTLLYWAAYEGNVRAARFLVEHGANVSAQSRHGWTPLRSACADGHIEVVKLLIRHGADVTAPESHGITPLHSASRTGNLDTVRILLDHGASLSARADYGCTPLHFASEGGQLEVARELLERGADASTPGFHARTPLSAAAFDGHVEVARLLIEHGGDMAHRDDEGWSLVNLASSNGHVDMMSLLVANGSDFEIPNGLGDTPLHVASNNGHLAAVCKLLELGARTESAEVDGATPLVFASAEGYVDIVMALLEKRASVEAADVGGETPLHRASSGGHVDTAAALLRNGASVSTTTTGLRTPLQAACCRGHVETARLLLANGADAHTTDEYDETPVSAAAFGGHDQVFQLLMDNGADCLTRNKGGWSPLHHACSCAKGPAQMVRALLDKGVAVDETTSKELWTPLNLASLSGSVDVAVLLLDKGADPTIVNQDGWSPLHTASAHGHVGVMNALLERDVSVLDNDGPPMLNFASLHGHVGAVKALIKHNPDIPLVGSDGRSPVGLASFGGHSEVVRFLISKGFTTGGADENGTTPLHCASELGHADVARILLESGAAMTPNHNGFRPIHVAAGLGKHEVVQVLVKSGADVSAGGLHGLTALHLASETGHVEIAEMLIEHGADVGVAADIRSTPMHSASSGGHVEVLQLLLNRGADADAATADGTTPLHVASSSGHLAAVRLLLGSGAGIAAVNKSEVTPLHWAAWSGHIDVLEELFGAGADHEATEQRGKTALVLASENGKTECARWLLEHGADVSTKGVGDRMPIHWASDGGHVELVELLLEHGSNLSVGDEFGLTPLALATFAGHLELVKLLIEKQADPDIARNDGRQPVDPSLFMPYVSLVDRERRVIALENDGSASAIDGEDDWAEIQFKLRSRALNPGPSDATGRTLSLPSVPQWDASNGPGLPLGEHRARSSSGSRSPATTQGTLCDACGAALQSGVGKMAVDEMAITQDIVRMIAGASAPPGPSPPQGRPPPKSSLFYHHMNVHSLIAAASDGCYICRAVWGRLDARKRQLLIDADPLASGKTYSEPFTTCMFFDMKSLFGDLESEEVLDMRLWAVCLSVDVHDMPDYRPGDIALFQFVPIQEVEGLDRIGDLPPATDSSESLEFAATKFQNCLRNHEACKRNTASEWLPSRLMCLDSVEGAKTVRLVPARDVATPAQYCTLSHCWGTAEFLKLTKDNMGSFSRGIPVSDLPKSFQDSFHVSLKLGVQYIWIDSLCIIQDDPDDWFGAASCMDEVYSHSVCNICATGASDSCKGLFATRDPALARPCEAEIPWCNEGSTFRVVDVGIWNTQVLKAPLNMRAWVVQEHLLAPRHLHFGASQIFWECLEVTAAEQYPDGLPKCIQFNDMSLRRRVHKYTPVLQADAEQDKMLLTGWAEIVRRYTAARITLPRDRAIAFAGIVRRLEGILGDKCDAGIWRSDIKCHLLWHVMNGSQGDGKPARRAEAYRAPSFSWMSVEGAISLQVSQTDDSLARVLSMDITESRGSITHGMVRLAGTLRPLRLSRAKEKNHNDPRLPRFRHGKAHLGWTMSPGSVALMDADGDYDGTYYCVLLAGEGKAKSVRGLILQETGKARGQFTRIGFIQCIGEDRELMRVHAEDEDTLPCESYDAVQKRHTISIV